MKKNIITILCCCVNVFALASDTNFVMQINELWKSQNASNLLMFTEINVATNPTPVTLFARGATAMTLQRWGVEATNLFEQAAQMISTNNAYSEFGKTRVIAKIQMNCVLFPAIIENFDQYSQPSWNTNGHVKLFTEFYDEAPFYEDLMEIATIELAEAD